MLRCLDHAYHSYQILLALGEYATGLFVASEPDALVVTHYLNMLSKGITTAREDANTKTSVAHTYALWWVKLW